MKCPICGKPTCFKDNPTRPFCSERCKLIDFGNWADENYRVPDEKSAGIGLSDEEMQQQQEEESSIHSNSNHHSPNL